MPTSPHDHNERVGRDPSGLSYAPVLHVDVRAAAPLLDDAALLVRVKERAADPSVFDHYKPFFWPGEISSFRWDSYDTRMAASTLKNYAAEADEGVAFLRNHNVMEDPVGHTISGKFTNASRNAPARVGLATAAAGLCDTLRRETGWGRETSHALADARALGNARWAADERATAAATRGERPPTFDERATAEAAQALPLQNTSSALLDQTTESARDQRASANLVGEIIGQWPDRQAHLDSLVTEAMHALN